MDPPPNHYFYPAHNHYYSHPPPPAAVPPSQTSNTTHFTPMSPYRSQNPTPCYYHNQPPIPSPYAPNSSFNAAAFQQNSWHPAPQSHPIIINNNHPPIPQPNHNDDYQRRLRNEVIFLHALWEQGPPNSNPHHHLKPSPTTAFKKKKNKNLTSPSVSDIPWPAPPESDSVWPEFPPLPTPTSAVVSEEDKARVSASRVQRKAIDSFRSFFRGKHGSDSEGESDDDDDGCLMFDYFLAVFEEDEELKGYYGKNWGNGEFLCLVCGGTGQKGGKKYKNGVALVQHTVTVSNTKKRTAHKTYGQVICKVFGWDINRLPLVSRNLSLQQGNSMSSAEACKDDPMSVDTNISVDGNEQLDPSKTAFGLGEDKATEKKETIDHPLILDNPSDQQGNEISSVHACKDVPVGIQTNVVSSVNDYEESGQSKATSDAREDVCAAKDISDLPSVSDNPGDQQGNSISSAEACKNDPVSVETNIASFVNGNEQSEPSKTTSDLGEDNAEKKETSDLPLILDSPSDQQGNEVSSINACKDVPIGIQTNVVPLVNDNEELGQSKATSNSREDIGTAKMDISDLPLVSDNSGDQQINDTSNAGTSTNHPDIAEESTDAVLNECRLSDPPNAVTDNAENFWSSLDPL